MLAIFRPRDLVRSIHGISGGGGGGGVRTTLGETIVYIAGADMNLGNGKY